MEMRAKKEARAKALDKDGQPHRKKLSKELTAEMIHKEIKEDPALAEKKSLSEMVEMCEDKYGSQV